MPKEHIINEKIFYTEEEMKSFCWDFLQKIEKHIVNMFSFSIPSILEKDFEKAFQKEINKLK
jgi:hypothetical protein